MHRGLALLIVFVPVIFILSGFPSLIIVLIGGVTLDPTNAESYPKMVSLTPIACFLYIIMTMGLAMIISLDHHQPRYYGRRFLVGWALILTAGIGLTALYNIGIV